MRSLVHHNHLMASPDKMPCDNSAAKPGANHTEFHAFSLSPGHLRKGEALHTTSLFPVCPTDGRSRKSCWTVPPQTAQLSNLVPTRPLPYPPRDPNGRASFVTTAPP
jgi:hypothetical protein